MSGDEKAAMNAAARSLLLDAANFAGTDIVTRDVVLANGEPTPLTFRAMDAGRFNAATASESDAARRMATVIAATVCDDDGAPVLTVDQVLSLKPAVYGALRDVVLDVNGFGAPGATPAGKA